MTLATPAQFVQSVRAHEIDPVAFCTHLLHTAASGEGTVDPSQTADEFGIHREAANHLHDLASEFGLVDFTSQATNRVRVNRNATIEFIQFLNIFDEYMTPSEAELLANNEVHDVELSIAVPSGFDGKSAELMARLIRLVRNAERELLLVTPFFTRFGVDVFVDHLASATDRGVDITLLTRDVTDNRENADHVERIRETVRSNGDTSNFHVYQYDSPHGRLHAKTLIADTEIAYVGSANLTNYSLKEAIEIGLIVRGPVVDELTDFFEIVRCSANTQKYSEGPTQP
ncbi:PLD-like domain-containing protein [Natronorubrum sediminis]|uniref:PLD-like domain-containing protein n=1 Tax=Natronorubrum sediminis TaxID=640943 RepID=A0A1H6FXL7_9EURY|nr:phospholipase D family protein [Natronorubrum sediminis]SEH15020.1 PLD-like domain-containing protein [Natronorubrum sediminis]